MGDEARLVDAAIERYERALVARDGGNDAAASELIAAALAGIEALSSEDAALARAQISITRAEIATRLQPDEAIELAGNAVEHAHKVRKLEPMLEASALYMLGKAERPTRGRRFGAASFERSLALWRKLEGDDSPYSIDAARSMAIACVKVADWERALAPLELVLARVPDPGLFLDRATVRERLGAVEAAREDLDRWLVIAPARPPDEQLRGQLVASRIAAATGDADGATEALGRARRIAAELPDEPQRQAAMLEAAAWLYARTSDPPWFLAAEVLMRRAAASAFTPAIADTAWRIAATWRYGVAEDLVQPAFAVLDIEAALQNWDPETLTYHERSGRQRLQLVVGGAPTSIERLADSRWRDLCVQRVFSAFHAEQFKGHEPNFVAPVQVTTLRLPPEHVLELLPSLRVPKWATTSTVMISSLGEVELTRVADLAVLATRAFPGDAAIAAVQRALPTLGREVAREMLAAPKQITLAPSVTIPLIPEE